MKLALGRLGSAGTRTLIQRAIASLRARGSDAHLWLPGVGTLNGLTTGNYLESTGNTLATVDNPTGLVLDALGSFGANLITNGDFSGPTSYFSEAHLGGSGAIVAGQLAVTASGGNYTGVQGPLSYHSPNATVHITANLVSGTGRFTLYFSGEDGVLENIDRTGPYTFSGVAKLRSDGIFIPVLRSAVSGQTTVWDNFVIREVSGIHLTQSTTANKGLLKQDAGSRYYWLFDATDLLTGTFPAGYESVTVIDAKSTGQMTTSAANVVGSYSIGPSYSSYGRIIIKGSITASELALYQGFANRLAGL